MDVTRAADVGSVVPPLAVLLGEVLGAVVGEPLVEPLPPQAAITIAAHAATPTAPALAGVPISGYPPDPAMS
jgi:hypothetical protein